MTQNKILSTNFNLENKYKITLTCIKWFYNWNMQLDRWINRYGHPIICIHLMLFILKKHTVYIEQHIYQHNTNTKTSSDL
jgi:hypothetical protein